MKQNTQTGGCGRRCGGGRRCSGSGSGSADSCTAPDDLVLRHAGQDVDIFRQQVVGT